MNTINLIIDYFRILENKPQSISERQKIQKKTTEEALKNGFFIIHDQLLHEQKIHVNLHPLPCHVNPVHLLHKHEYFEMIYVFRGKCYNLFQNQDVELNQGELLLLNPQTAHCIYTDPDNDCIFNIMICKNFFRHSIDVLLKDNQLFSSFFIDCMFQINHARDYLHFFPDQYRPDLIEHLIIESFEKQLCYESITQSILIELFALLARHSHSYSPMQTNQPHTLLNILSYIQDNLSSVTLNQLAEKFQYSTSYLSRMIKQGTGQTFSEILQDFRLNKAKYYLEQTDLPILEIALSVGFHDTSHFYKVFRKHFNCSPAKYRSAIL